MSIDALRQELRDYYRTISFDRLGKNGFESRLWAEMDEFAAAHPDYSPLRLKAAMYDIIAERFEPVIFRNSPFYSEMGVNVAESDGYPFLSASGWLLRRNHHLFKDADAAEYERYMAAGRHGIHLSYGPYPDIDHHCCSFSYIITHGLSHIFRKAQAALPQCVSPEETEFVEAAITGLLAVKKIAEKFSVAAKKTTWQVDNPQQHWFLSMAAATARKIPWQAPETFYEALCALWFLHEVGASMDGVRMYVLGHLDRLLGDFYQRDLAVGRITYDEAYDLICRFMIYIDSKIDLERMADDSYNRQELGGTLILGGCDENGKTVCNEVTFMVLKAHHELKMLYPKIHCRISQNSPAEYLAAINRDFLSGRNVISFLNDDGIIPAQIKAGKRPEDARCYVAGGCWEVIVEGCEHSAGANCYFNLAKLVDMSIHPDPQLETETGIHCRRLDGAPDFETVYRTVMDNIIAAIRQMCGTIGSCGRVWPRVNPSPLFSACLAGCLEDRRDYTAGGGRYNPHGLPLTNFTILVDSLLTIQELCFERKTCSLEELLTAVRADWDGFDALRAEVLGTSHFGDNTPKSNTLAQRILNEIYARTRDLTNERGGPFQLGLYSYRDIIDWAAKTRATPDGRKAGDFLAQGLTPSRYRHLDITSLINSASTLDLTQYPANSVITISLPLGGIDSNSLESLERVLAASGIGMLQLNCVNKDDLLDAQVHPERHRDLIVRLYGYSARFVKLNREMQDEFISRSIYTC